MPAEIIDIRTGRRVNPSPASSPAEPPTGNPLALGCTIENGSLRAHRYRDHVVLWDLTFAGKRGKKVAKLNITPSFGLSAARRDEVLEQISLMVQGLRSFGVAAAVVGEYAMTYPQTLDLTSYEERGVDIKPAGVAAVVINTSKLSLLAEPFEFTLRCNVDLNNLPTSIPPIKSSRKAAAAFYRWAVANQDRIATMSYREVLAEMQRLGIRYHSFCAMD